MLNKNSGSNGSDKRLSTVRDLLDAISMLTFKVKVRKYVLYSRLLVSMVR